MCYSFWYAHVDIEINSRGYMLACKTLWKFMITSSNGNLFRVTGLCAGNPSVTGGYPSQRPVTRSFDAFFDLHLNNGVNNRDDGDLERHGTHYDVTVMLTRSLGMSSIYPGGRMHRVPWRLGECGWREQSHGIIDMPVVLELCWSKLWLLTCRLRILRYDPAHFFLPNYDGNFVRDNRERSFITVHLYLNEVG